jgi:hypothetical protein
MKWTTGLVIVFSSLLFSAPSFAGDVALADWCVNNNGDSTTFCNGGSNPLGGNVDLSAFDQTLEPGTNSLGSITITLVNGINNVAFWADYDVAYATAGSFQDVGSANGTLPANYSYELDDPNTSSIFSDFAAFPTPALSGANNVGVGAAPPDVCCDVSWALGVGGLNVDVADGGSGTVTFTVGNSAPCDPSSSSCFYLEQTSFQNPDDSIYLSASYNIIPPQGNVTPEPSTFVLGLGALGMVAIGIRGKRVRA